jgi:chromosome segregation ATPase
VQNGRTYLGYTFAFHQTMRWAAAVTHTILAESASLTMDAGRAIASDHNLIALLRNEIAALVRQVTELQKQLAQAQAVASGRSREDYENLINQLQTTVRDLQQGIVQREATIEIWEKKADESEKLKASNYGLTRETIADKAQIQALQKDLEAARSLSSRKEQVAEVSGKDADQTIKALREQVRLLQLSEGTTSAKLLSADRATEAAKNRETELKANIEKLSAELDNAKKESVTLRSSIRGLEEELVNFKKALANLKRDHQEETDSLRTEFLKKLQEEAQTAESSLQQQRKHHEANASRKDQELRRLKDSMLAQGRS